MCKAYSTRSWMTVHNTKYTIIKERLYMRLLHTMLRVGNLEKSVEFYAKVLKMQEIKRTDYPNGKFTLVFMGYGSEESHTLLELTHNWETDKYDLGNGFGHLAVSVSDIFATCDMARNLGVNITREPGPMKFAKPGGSNIAFIEDPDGYKIELIERR